MMKKLWIKIGNHFMTFYFSICHLYFTAFCIIHKLIHIHIHLQCQHIPWYFKNEQIYRKSSQVVQQSYKFFFYKKSKTIALGDPNPWEPYSIVQFESQDLKKSWIVNPTWKAKKLQESKKWRMSNETFSKWWIFSYPTIFP